MAEPINLAPVRVHAISVPMRPDPKQLHKLDEMMLQANGDGTVQADLFGTDPQGKPYHESRTFNEQEYEQLRKHFMTRELATLPPFSSFKSGNTIGRVVGETVPAQVSASEANPPIEAETEEEGITGEQILDGIQLGLDIVGLVPVFGEIADIGNAGLSAVRGDYVGAGLSLLSAIPFVGYVGTAGKASRYGAKIVTSSGKKTGGKTKGKKKIDPCAALQDGVPGDNYRGGKHGKIKQGGSSYSPRRESHHMPADSAYSKINGRAVSSDAKPAIQLDINDHYATASWGSKGKQYSKIQEKLIQGGKAGYRAAMMMDIEDIRSKFGDKYDPAIAQMLAWAKCKEYI
ncbi:hypothetical protein HX810_06525 [Pseudomonas salomonii]|uniref:Uncharacterized protein n=1 Tax=Pseudomonas salomonii TaxID=191391 RepID=A0A7Y8GBW0_9PSED|nr:MULTISPECIES: hypothetical protein [Pseudomonas]NWF07317.1 hypothetical protein [Pseudomonas salomonii]CRM52120.1 hypothetical protein [Pseudomonas sp. 58 R 3]